MAYQKIGFKNGNVLTAEQLIHMEDGIIDAEKKAQAGGTGTGLPSGGEPYMQLVTDGEGKAGWEQRLAWKTEEKVDILPEQTVTTEDDEDSFYADLEASYQLEEGKEYTVIWDGTEYKCVAFAYVDWGAICIGNGSIIGSTDGGNEPFCIQSYSDGNACLNTTGVATYTIRVVGDVFVYHKIDSKYIDGNTVTPILFYKKDTISTTEADYYSGLLRGGVITHIVWGNWIIDNINPGGSQSAGVTKRNIVIDLVNGQSYLAERESGTLYDEVTFSQFEFTLNSWGNGSFSYSNGFNSSLREGGGTYKFPYVSATSVGGNRKGDSKVMFRIDANGTESKPIEFLGDSTVVAEYVMLYSSTENSDKKFRITVDDSGALTATEVTE